MTYRILPIFRYIYEVKINKKTVLTQENQFWRDRGPKEYKDVKVFAGAPWNAEAKGKIKNLFILPESAVSVQGKLSFQLTLFPKAYFFLCGSHRGANALRSV